MTNNIESTTDRKTQQPLFAIPVVVRSFISRFYWCKIWKWHKWTCAAEKGIKPTQEQLNTGLLGLYEYAKMYCERCGHVYETSNKLICKYKNLDSK